MTTDPLIRAELQPVIHTEQGSALPAPTVDAEHVADDVFTPDQSHFAATVLGMQTGLMLLHHIVVESLPSAEEEHGPHPENKTRPIPAA
jgi:hypothetical protein